MRHAAVVLILIGLITPVMAQPVADPDPERFAKAIAEFERWDAKNTPPAEPVLFVGSSSIVGWKSAAGFPDLTVINRGFGGSHMSDLLHYYDRVVKPYAPRAIVLYEGDNDIAGGKPPEQVAADYAKFFERTRRDFPQAPVIVVAIKPSRARWEQWPAMREANERIAKLCAADPRLHFADIAPVLLGESGEPDDSLFVSDGLHLNAAGYARWERLVGPLLNKALHDAARGF